ncbi:MAG: SGNH/GDSL hydrolase family protein [Verrucomicrobiota bacterium]
MNDTVVTRGAQAVASKHRAGLRRIPALLRSGAQQYQRMKSVFRFILYALFLGAVVLPSHAGFTSLFIFGDSISSTTNGPGDAYYYNTNGLRWSNGRIWVEVLAQRQGLTCDTNKNWSYYGHNSTGLVSNVSSLVVSNDVNTALFIVWVNNADFVNDMAYIYPSQNTTTWSNAINLSLTNHFKAVTNLYAKGVRTLIMPNAVDITKIPQYNLITSPAEKSFIRQRVIEFNTGFAGTASNLMTSLPGLKIYIPDLFSLLDDVLVHAANYGLTNALYLGESIDVIEDPSLTDKSLNGPGTNYIFWDWQAPTAKFHAVIADQVQQLIAQVYISGITQLVGTNRLVIGNTPVGRHGVVEGSTNFVNWTTNQNITSSNVMQTVLVPASGPMQFYRLRFPFSWSWP